MHIDQMTQDLLVRIVREIDLFPVGLLQPGLIGTVEVTDGDGETAPCRMVKLTEEFPGLDHWKNRLQVWSTHMVICVADDFEPIEPAG
jgi:hypothetical protein